MARTITSRVRKTDGTTAGRHLDLVFVCCTLLLSLHLSTSPAIGEQSRDECNACCSRSGYDEYYEEQCKLKCFRNHDHCTGKGERPSAAAAEPKEPDRAPRESHRVAAEPAAPRERDVRLAWPNPLNLVAGKEGEAAAQILAVNGVSPQHPFYNAALQDIQVILIDFLPVL